MKVLMVGGGTGGPNAPLVAVAEYIKKDKPETSLVFVTDKSAPAGKMLSIFNAASYTVPTGKWRRYFSVNNFLDIFKILAGIIKSYSILKKEKPDVIFSAGSYVSLPVGLAAWFLQIPTVIHQQDLIVARTNRILVKKAKIITVSLPETKNFFPKAVLNKIQVTGNPIRKLILEGDKNKAIAMFGLDSSLPTVLILGGGTGSESINRVVENNLKEFSGFANLIHVTGAGKLRKNTNQKNYHQFEFISDDLPYALAVADVVVSRAGFSFISELSACKKSVILVPLPNSPQEENAKYLTKRGAAITVNQKDIEGRLAETVQNLLKDQNQKKKLSENIGKLMPHDAAERVGEIIVFNSRHYE